MIIYKNVPLLVSLNGDVSYHIENIITKMYDGTILKYQALKTHHTLLSAKSIDPRSTSLFELSMHDMISNSKEIDGWYNADFIVPQPNCGLLRQCVDILFYDEFIFLFEEDLIRFDDVHFIDEDNNEVVHVYTKKLKATNQLIGVFE